MKTIKRSQVINIIKENENKIFSVIFIKKDGTMRKMNCKRKVKKHLKGGKLAFNPIVKGLLSVYDMVNKGYRFINLNTLISIKIENKEYKIEESV